MLCDDRKYQKSVEHLQTAMDKMHVKGLTVEQYLTSVLSAVCITVMLSGILSLNWTHHQFDEWMHLFILYTAK